MSTRDLRHAPVEALFREVNERIAELANRNLDDGFQIVCECANTECQDKITIPIDDYRHVRESADRFIVVPGHTVDGVEDVLVHEDRYEVVEKRVLVDDRVLALAGA